MNRITCTKEEIDTAIQELTAGLSDPLYRALGSKAERDYQESETLAPNPGSLSAGTGVFFTNNLAYAKGFLGRRLIITTREHIDPARQVIDTRQPGYDAPARKKLDELKGPGTYTGYQLWDEITRHDTITNEGGPPGTYVYSRRAPLGKESLIAEVHILGEEHP